MDIIDAQKDIATNVLDSLRQTVDPTALVAGGAVRNWYFKRPANDIDVFVKADSIDEFPYWVQEKATLSTGSPYNLEAYGKGNPYNKEGELINPVDDTKLLYNIEAKVVPYNKGSVEPSYNEGDGVYGGEFPAFTAYEMDYGGTMVQFLFGFGEPARAVATFPLELSRAAFNGTKYFYTDEFMMGVMNKQLKWSGPRHLEVNQPYVDKIAAQFPDYKVIL